MASVASVASVFAEKMFEILLSPPLSSSSQLRYPCCNRGLVVTWAAVTAPQPFRSMFFATKGWPCQV